MHIMLQGSYTRFFPFYPSLVVQINPLIIVFSYYIIPLLHRLQTYAAEAPARAAEASTKKFLPVVCMYIYLHHYHILYISMHFVLWSIAPL